MHYYSAITLYFAYTLLQCVVQRDSEQMNITFMHFNSLIKSTKYNV